MIANERAGPKLYVAKGTHQDESSLGTTRLHLDVAPAFNVQRYVAPDTGHALWHIFAREDADKLRAYLTDRFNLSHEEEDPISSQEYYLTPAMLQELSDKYAVIPFTFHQHLHEAIYIPSGCPHQVRP